MSFATRKKVLVVLILFLAVWPLVHYALVRSYQISPWKFFGWAMYCRPENRISVFLAERTPTGLRALSRGVYTPPVMAEVRLFQRERQYYGFLASPERVAAALRKDSPGLHGLSVVVENLQLDPKTTRFRSDRVEYRYDWTTERGQPVPGSHSP